MKKLASVMLKPQSDQRKKHEVITTYEYFSDQKQYFPELTVNDLEVYDKEVQE